MRILAIADRPPQRPIREWVAEQSIDVIVTLGDLEMHQIRELETITHIPKLGVYGNHCSGKYMESLGIQNMHLHIVEIQGVRFGGMEGCVRYKDSPSAVMYTQEEAVRMLRDFPCVDVMLAHAPPYGVNDEPDDPTHAGYEGLREYVERCRPKHLLHGHTYPSAQQLVTRLGETEVIYVFGEKLIEIMK